MFNFFNEIKSDLKYLKKITLDSYNIINISGSILYIEGHIGITSLSKEIIVFKVKGGRIVVEGENLIISELTDNTIKIVGKIKLVETF
ncbi:MAG: YabP/YqfC family sporulation protein [Clostridia bacterium]|nr:YabP/YqfC family sporulation protein [Clostridia bacterium]